MIWSGIASAPAANSGAMPPTVHTATIRVTPFSLSAQRLAR